MWEEEGVGSCHLSGAIIEMGSNKERVLGSQIRIVWRGSQTPRTAEQGAEKKQQVTRTEHERIHFGIPSEKVAFIPLVTV